MKKKCLLYFLLSLTTTVNAQLKKSFYDTTSFDKIKLYMIDTSVCKSAKYFVDENYKVSKCFKFYKELSESEANKIMKILNNKTTYGNPPLSCSTKELGILFEKVGKSIAYISLSFECDNIKSDNPIYANEYYKIDAGTDGYYLYSTFSKKGRRKLIKEFGNIGITSGMLNVH